MKYNLSSPNDQKKAFAYLNKLKQKGAKIELREITKRSLQQNSYLHVCITFVAMQVGSTIEYVKTELYKKQANRDLYVISKNTEKLGVIEDIRSSTKLSKEEMAKSIDNFIEYIFQKTQIVIPPASNEEFLFWVMQEYEKQQQYL